MALVRLYEGRDSMDAHHVRAVLETHGIVATVMGDHLLEAAPHVPTLNMQPTVWVHGNDAERALAVLADVRTEGVMLPNWVCPGCEESVEAQYAVCWNCGKPQPNTA